MKAICEELFDVFTKQQKKTETNSDTNYNCFGERLKSFSFLFEDALFLFIMLPPQVLFVLVRMLLSPNGQSVHPACLALQQHAPAQDGVTCRSFNPLQNRWIAQKSLSFVITVILSRHALTAIRQSKAISCFAKAVRFGDFPPAFLFLSCAKRNCIRLASNQPLSVGTINKPSLRVSFQAF